MENLSCFDASAVNHRPATASRAKRGLDARKQAAKRNGYTKMQKIAPEDFELRAHGTMARTKTLVSAAVRVWELKRGLRS